MFHEVHEKFNFSLFHYINNNMCNLFLIIFSTEYITFDIKNEKECKNAIRTEEEERLNGVFTFSYPDSASSFPITHRNFDIDRSWEGTMFLFPANLAHSVNPFYTSNDYRVTISGNVIFEFNEEDEE